MKKILVVDDEPAMRLALREVLRRSQYMVVEADGGPEALERLDAEADIALVLSDVRMPDMTGTELLRVVQSRRPELPVLIMTAFGTIEDAVEAMRLGARDYILKPFTGDAIVEVIGKALRSAGPAATALSPAPDPAAPEVLARVGADLGARAFMRLSLGAAELNMAAEDLIAEAIEEYLDARGVDSLGGEEFLNKLAAARQRTDKA